MKHASHHSNSEMETPFQQLTRLNSLFSYYSQNPYQPRTLKQSQTIRDFTAFNVPIFYKGLNQSLEKQDTISNRAAKENADELFWGKHRSLLRRTMNQLSNDKLPRKEIGKSLNRQIYQRKPFAEQTSSQFVKDILPELQRQGLEKKINVRSKAQASIDIQRKQRSQHQQHEKDQHLTVIHYLGQRSDLQKKIATKLYQKIELKSSENRVGSTRPSEIQEWEKYFKDTYKRKYHSYGLQGVLKNRVEGFDGLITKQLAEIDQFYENSTKF